MTAIINIFGVPCSGKSTFASELLFKLKKQGYNVELCPEIFKAWTYNNNELLNDPYACWAAQYLSNCQFNKSLKTLDFLIIEAPSLNSACYSPFDSGLREISKKLIAKSSYKNIAIHLIKPFDYNPIGRKPNIQDDYDLYNNIWNNVADAFAPEDIFRGSYDYCMKQLTHLIYKNY